MIKLHIVQAEFGDCFILESTSNNESTSILIDGGPYQTFKNHLKSTLQKIPSNKIIDLIILSHVDNDHIIGLLDLLNELKNQRENGTKELVKIKKLWHNSFKDLFELPDEPERLLPNIFPKQISMRTKNVMKSIIIKGFQQGADLTQLSEALKIPINTGFDGVIAVDCKIKSIFLKDIGLHILGPTKKNLENLMKEWNDWLSRRNQKTLTTEFGLNQILDKSVPNLASIMFLAQIKNRKLLFTGDGLGQDIMDVLSKSKMMDKNGKFYVDILKVPHHGSDRNVSKTFFDSVLAEYYIISANGLYDNPSTTTLKWIIEGERPKNKAIKIVVTNETSVIKETMNKYEPKKFKYEFICLKDRHHLTISLK